VIFGRWSVEFCDTFLICFFDTMACRIVVHASSAGTAVLHRALTAPTPHIRGFKFASTISRRAITQYNPPAVVPKTNTIRLAELSKPSSRRKAHSLSASFDHVDFTRKFLEQVDMVPHATDPYSSSQALRKLVESGILQFNDMVDHPEKFFSCTSPS